MVELDSGYSVIKDNIGLVVLRNDLENVFVLILDTDSKDIITFNGSSEQDVKNMNEMTREHLNKEYFYIENEEVKYRVGGLKENWKT